MPVNPDPNSGWASWLSQFIPQVGAPQLGNAINSPAQGPSLGRIGLPQAMGGQGVYQPPAPQQPGPPMQLGMPPGPMDPSIMAQMARQGTPGGGASGSWGAPGPAAASTAAPGQLGGATGSWGPPNAPIDPYGLTKANAPIDPYTTSPGRPAVAPGMAIGSPAPAVPPPRPAGLGAPPAGAMAQNSPFVQIARPNAPAGGAAYGRGGPPVMSALDLSRLFGRRTA